MDKTENIFTRLVKAQADFKNIRKDNKATAFGNGRGYSYATISDVLEVVRPILNAHGLAVMQRTATEAERVGVETIIYSNEGESLASGMFFVPTTGLTQKGAQAYGSALSYARRYSVTSFLGLAYGDEDDDARKASEDFYEKKPSTQKRKPQPTPSAPEPAAEPAPEPLDIESLENIANTYFGAQVSEYKDFFSLLSGAEKAHLKNSGLHEKIKASLKK
jgi:hypothetical protein